MVKSNNSASQATIRKGYEKPTLVKGPVLSAVTATLVSRSVS